MNGAQAHVNGAAAGERASLEIPPQPRSIALSRLFAAAVARRFGADEEVVDDVKVAISEAVTNAVKAHEMAELVEPVVVVAELDDAELRFRVVDRGAGFEPTDDDDTPAGGLYEGSLGLLLIRSLFPDAVVERNSDAGMTVRFAVARARVPE